MTTKEKDASDYPYDTRIEDGCFITMLAFIILISCAGGIGIVWAIIEIIN